MSTHNICFYRETRKILCGYPLLSVAMDCGYLLSTTSDASYENMHVLSMKFLY